MRIYCEFEYDYCVFINSVCKCSYCGGVLICVWFIVFY